MSSNTGNTIIALLTGALVGAGLGILFAPDKGSVTRSKIKTGIEDTKDELMQKMHELSAMLKDKAEHVKTDLSGTFEKFVSSGSYKAEEVIEFLEKQLETLKAQNAKLHK